MNKMFHSFRQQVQGTFIKVFLVASLLLTEVVIFQAVFGGLQSSASVYSHGSINYPTLGYYKGAIIFAKYLARDRPEYLPWALEVAQDLNINTLRLRELHKVTLAQLNQVLTDMYAVGIKAWPVLPLFPYYPNDTSGAKAEAYRWIVQGGFVGDPRILLWDIINEPMNIDDPAALNWLKEVLAYVKSLDPSKPVTFGGWHSAAYGWNNPVDIPLFIDYVDIVQPHYFWGPKHTYSQHADLLKNVSANSKGKPILFGAWGYKSDNDTIQAEYYSNVFKAIQDVRKLGINFIGASFWVLLPPCPVELAGIIHSDGSYRAAALVVKEVYTQP